MHRAWKDRMSKTPGAEVKYTIAKEAELSRYLIYARKSRVWYTPDGFMESNEQPTIFRGKDDPTEFLVRDPEAGLREKKYAVEAAKNALSDYEAMLNGYMASFGTK